MKEQILAATLMLSAALAGAQEISEEQAMPPLLTLENSTAQLVIDPAGGALIDFHLAGQDLNPLTWQAWSPNPDNPAEQPPRPGLRGHFLALDRWGRPSPADEALGITWHGEAPYAIWSVDKQSEASAQMAAQLPLAGMTVDREVKMIGDVPAFTVKETVTNENPHGRIFTLVQHATLGTPFISPQTIVDANATQGLVQMDYIGDPVEHPVQWPMAVNEQGEEVDMRYFTGATDPDITSYVIDETDEYGWVTTASPEQSLLIGYLWKTEEYPWLNLWRQADAQGNVRARGVEFGISGRNALLEDLVNQGRIFGRSTLGYLEPKASLTLQFAAFLAAVPQTLTGVEDVAYDGQKITITPRGQAAEDIVIETGALFGE